MRKQRKKKIKEKTIQSRKSKEEEEEEKNEERKKTTEAEYINKRILKNKIVNNTSIKKNINDHLDA